MHIFLLTYLNIYLRYLFYLFNMQLETQKENTTKYDYRSLDEHNKLAPTNALSIGCPLLLRC